MERLAEAPSANDAGNVVVVVEVFEDVFGAALLASVPFWVFGGSCCGEPCGGIFLSSQVY